MNVDDWNQLRWPRLLREPLEGVAGGVDAHQVASLAGGADVGECGVGRGDRTPLDPFGRGRLGVVEQEWVVRHEAALLTELQHERRQPGVVDRPDARQPDAAADVSPALDQVDRQRALIDAAGLADVAVVQSDEVGPFPGDVREQDLVADERGRGSRDEVVEVRLVVAAHSSPPNTSMSENLHAGDAWPVPIIWLSSPLPQFGVPITVKLSRFATPLRLRQNVEEMPR